MDVLGSVAAVLGLCDFAFKVSRSAFEMLRNCEEHDASIKDFNDRVEKLQEILQEIESVDGIEQAREPQRRCQRDLISLGATLAAIPTGMSIHNYSKHLRLREMRGCTRHIEEVSKDLMHRWTCDSGAKNEEAIRQAYDDLAKIPESVPAVIRAPSAGTFLVACLAFAVALALYHQMHRSHDKLQNLFLGAGMIAAMVTAAVVRESVQSALMIWLPWSGLYAVILSSILHELARWLQVRNSWGPHAASDSSAVPDKQLLILEASEKQSCHV